MEVDNDPVEHPSHYTRFGAEVIDITEWLSFNRGNAVKYLARAGHKENANEIEDLKKALWYTKREIDRMLSDKEPAIRIPITEQEREYQAFLENYDDLSRELKDRFLEDIVDTIALADMKDAR